MKFLSLILFYKDEIDKEKNPHQYVKKYLVRDDKAENLLIQYLEQEQGMVVDEVYHDNAIVFDMIFQRWNNENMTIPEFKKFLGEIIYGYTLSKDIERGTGESYGDKSI